MKKRASRAAASAGPVKDEKGSPPRPHDQRSAELCADDDIAPHVESTRVAGGTGWTVHYE